MKTEAFFLRVLKSLRVKDLQYVLERKNCPKSGLKPELIERLAPILEFDDLLVSHLKRICKAEKLPVPKSKKEAVRLLKSKTVDSGVATDDSAINNSAIDKTLYIPLSSGTDFQRFQAEVERHWPNQILKNDIFMFSGNHPYGFVTFPTLKIRKEAQKERIFGVQFKKLGKKTMEGIFKGIQSSDHSLLRTILPKLPIAFGDSKAHPFVNRKRILLRGTFSTDDGVRNIEIWIHFCDRFGYFKGFYIFQNNSEHETLRGTITKGKDDSIYKLELTDLSAKGTFNSSDKTAVLRTRDPDGKMELKLAKPVDSRIYLNEASLTKIKGIKHLSSDAAKKIIELREKKSFHSWGNMGYRFDPETEELLQNDPNVMLTSYDAFQRILDGFYPVNLHRSSGTIFIHSPEQERDHRLDPFFRRLMQDQGVLFLDEHSTRRSLTYYRRLRSDENIDELQKAFDRQEGFDEEKSFQRSFRPMLPDRRTTPRDCQELSEHNDAIGRVVVFMRVIGGTEPETRGYGTATLQDGYSALTSAHVIHYGPSVEVAIFFEHGYHAHDVRSGHDWKSSSQYCKSFPSYSRQVTRFSIDPSYLKHCNDDSMEICKYDIAMIFFNQDVKFDHKCEFSNSKLRKGDRIRLDGYGGYPPKGYQHPVEELLAKTKLKNYPAQYVSGMAGTVTRELKHFRDSVGDREMREISMFGISGHSGSAIYRTERHALSYDEIDDKRQIVGIYHGGLDGHKKFNRSTKAGRVVAKEHGGEQNLPTLCKNGFALPISSVITVITPEAREMIGKWIEDARIAREGPDTSIANGVFLPPQKVPIETETPQSTAPETSRVHQSECASDRNDEISMSDIDHDDGMNDVQLDLLEELPLQH